MAKKLIKNVPLTSEIKDEYKFPISEGGVEAKTANFMQVKDYIVKNIDTSDTFDASLLYNSAMMGEAVTEEFQNNLLNAIDEHKIIFIADTTNPNSPIIAIVVFINRDNSKLSLSVFNTIISLDIQLDLIDHTVTIIRNHVGEVINRFENDNSINIFNVTTQNTNGEIQRILTNTKGEIMLPSIGDTFVAHINNEHGQLIKASGIVTSRFETKDTQNLTVISNDPNGAYFMSSHIQLGYDPNIGVNSLTIKKADHYIIDDLLLTREYVKDYVKSFDVTPLYSAISSRNPLTDDFYNKLLEAVNTNKLLYISDKTNGVVNLLVVYINQKPNEMIFSAFDGRSSFIFSLNMQTKVVSLDTEKIGAEFSIYNNTLEVNLFGLQKTASSNEIQLCFTNTRDEVQIPDTGDIFNIVDEDGISESGIVISRIDDINAIKLYVLRNNFVDNHVVFNFFKFSYNAAQGLDSLRLEHRIENIVDPSLITVDKMKTIRTGLVQTYDASALLDKIINHQNVDEKIVKDLKKAIDLGYLIQIKDTISSPGETNVINMSASSYDQSSICLISASENTMNKIIINLDDYSITMEIHNIVTPPPNDDVFYVMKNGAWVDIRDVRGFV